jgi:hypothetical protein
MYIGYSEQRTAEEHYRYLLEEAETERFIHAKEDRQRLLERALFNLGRRLVAWGGRLQAHHSLEK